MSSGGIGLSCHRKQGGPGRGKRVHAQRPVLPDGDPGKRVAEVWRKHFCVKNGDGTRLDPKKIQAAKEDARLRCERICEQQSIATVRGTGGTGDFERYTPKKYVELAREVMGVIDCDPASSNAAQLIVKAKKFLTIETDGLAREWRGHIWLNPPFHRELMPKFIDKLVMEIKAGHVTEAILLTNIGSGTTWFNAAFRACASLCFARGRIHFLRPNGAEALLIQGQCFFYFGSNPQRFEKVFRAIGPCARPSANYDPH
jgi:DNA N-6-adenine-methyltransferase (Dam)